MYGSIAARRLETFVYLHGHRSAGRMPDPAKETWTVRRSQSYDDVPMCGGNEQVRGIDSEELVLFRRGERGGGPRHVGCSLSTSTVYRSKRTLDSVQRQVGDGRTIEVRSTRTNGFGQVQVEFRDEPVASSIPRRRDLHLCGNQSGVWVHGKRETKRMAYMTGNSIIDRYLLVDCVVGQNRHLSRRPLADRIELRQILGHQFVLPTELSVASCRTSGCFPLPRIEILDTGGKRKDSKIRSNGCNGCSSEVCTSWPVQAPAYVRRLGFNRTCVQTLHEQEQQQKQKAQAKAGLLRAALQPISLGEWLVLS